MARSSTPAPTSNRAARSGSRWAACSSARSGATAATSRRTGARTGCIANRSAILDLWARGDGGMATYAQLPAEQQAALQRPPAGSDAHQYLRPGHRHHHPAAGSRSRARPTWPRITRACSATTRPPPSLREAYAMKKTPCPTPGHRRALTAFFWWTAWAAATERPREAATAWCPASRACQASRSPTPTTGPASRWSATRRRPRCGCGRPSACCS